MNNIEVIRSLAILKVLYDSKKYTNYLDIFLPMIATLIKYKEYKVIDNNICSKDFKERFGFIVPAMPMTIMC